jgi:molybdopterin-guanine dinucleotide biosynthesis protein A
MGTDKAWLEWMGQPLIFRSIGILRGLCSEILISANDPGFEKTGYPVVRDLYDDSGPISGVHAGLSKSLTGINLVLPVDTPLVKPELYEYLLKQDLNADVIVPMDEKDYYQPLCAVYNKSILPLMENQIRNRELGFGPLFKKANCFALKIKPSLNFYTENLFLNINTPFDLNNLSE